MAQVSLERIVADPTIQIRHGYNVETVVRYMQVLDKMPAVTVFDTKEGYLLADGFHRVEAARRLGWKSIKAGIRKGTRRDAEDFATEANSTNALPLTVAEREDAVRRKLRLHPELPYARIAEQLAVSQGFVSNVVALDTMRSRLGKMAEGLSRTQLSDLTRLPAEDQVPMAQVTASRNWDSTMLHTAINNLKDERIPEEFKERLRTGQIEPVFVNRDGTYAWSTEAIVRDVRQRQEADAVYALEQMFLAVARLRQFSWAQIMRDADPVRRERIRSELPGYVAFLEEGLKPALQILEGKGH